VSRGARWSLERKGQDREVLAKPSPHVVTKLACHEGGVVLLGLMAPGSDARGSGRVVQDIVVM
jgi:hypothetical protein